MTDEGRGGRGELHDPAPPPYRGKARATCRPVITFKSRSLGTTSPLGSRYASLDSPKLPPKTTLRDFVLQSSSQMLRRSLGAMDLDPEPGSDDTSRAVGEVMSRDREGHLRLNMNRYQQQQQQQGRPVSPNRPTSTPTKDMTGRDDVMEEDDPSFILSQQLPNIQASIPYQHGFLTRLRTPQQHQSRDAAMRDAGAHDNPSEDFPAWGEAAEDTSWAGPPSTPGPGPPAFQMASEGLLVRTMPNPDAVALFENAFDISRPATAGSVMGQATWLTSEEDVFHMASNLGIIHPGTRSASGAAARRTKLTFHGSSSPVSSPGAAMGIVGSRPGSFMTSRRVSGNGSTGIAQRTGQQLQKQKPAPAPAVARDLLPIMAATATGPPSPTGAKQAGLGAATPALSSPPAMRSTSASPASALSLHAPPSQGVSLKVLQQIADEVLLKDKSLTTGEVLQQVILPETLSFKCRYTDLLAGTPMLLGTPQYYICHSWRGNFVEMVTAITQLLSVRVPKQNLDGIFFWLDILCDYQHEGAHAADLAQLRDVIATCERTLLILDREGSSLLRTCCLWEIWVTSLLDKFDKGRVLVLSTSLSWGSVTHAYMLMDVASSQSQTTWNLPSAAKDVQRRGMLADISRGKTDEQSSSGQTSDIKDVILTGVKRELQRAEKVGNLSPRWLVISANSAALVLHLRRNYSDADDVLKQALRTIEKAPARTMPEHDIMACKLHVALNLHEKGSSQDAEAILQDALNRHSGLLPHEVYLESMAVMSTVQCQNRSYMRAEMLCHRALAEIQQAYGKAHPLYTKHLLQLASIAASQRLVKQAEESAHDVLTVCVERHPGLSTALVPIIKAEKHQHKLSPVHQPSRKMSMTNAATSAQHAAAQLQHSASRLRLLGAAAAKDVGKDDGEEPESVLIPLIKRGSAKDASRHDLVESREHEVALLDAVSALHVLAFCACNGHRAKLALAMIQQVREVRGSLLSENHPLTIESQYLQAKILVRLENLDQARDLMLVLGKKMIRTWGSDQPETVEALSELADLHREMHHDAEAKAVEHELIEIGKALLSYPKTMDRVRHMSALCTILAARDHLVDKASLLLAKTLLVYREKLGSEHKLTKLTRSQLLDMVEREKQLGARALNQAKSGDPDMYKIAEVMYKQALAIGKLVNPNLDQSSVAEGLADSQFGQGKIHDAQKTLRHNGLLNSNMKDGLPTSFLRFINNRVTKNQADSED